MTEHEKRQLSEEIKRLKKEKGVCILAHAYQSHDIWAVADYIGDSYGLSVQAAKSEADTVIMCGVRFMAETVKILSPKKRVLLSHPNAGCPMAEQISVDDVKALREKYPDYAVVAYINTTSELKTACDVCVTSASAVKVISNMEENKILFIPDCNLGAWVAEKLPNKTFKLIDGGCPVHKSVTEEDVISAKRAHPDAEILMHPECPSAVIKHADYAGSTTGIMDYAEKSEKRRFIIGTENSIVEHLKIKCPDKEFFTLSEKCVCQDMRLTTLSEVYDCLTGRGGEEITLSDSVMEKARKCIDRMLELGR